MSDLDPLFRPASIAVYGASASGGKLGNQLLDNATGGAAGGAAGGASSGGVTDVVAVHPTASSVQGVPASPKLQRAVDLALISVPPAQVSSAVRDAAAAGTRVAVVLTSGFGETGDEGRRQQDELVSAARAAGTRLVGPNCMGVVSHLGGGRWLNGSYFWSVPDRPGGVSFVSQSGAFGGMFFAEARRRGFGMARFLSVGNSADVTLTDALAWLGDDDATTVVGVFAEAIPGGRAFVDAARRVTERKPVVVVKAGKAAAGARAAASHTGSLAGAHGPVQAAFLRAGVREAATSTEFFDQLAFQAASPGRRVGSHIAVVTISGGPSVLAADAAERAGLELPPPSAATVDTLRRLVPSFAALGNPVDLTPQCPPANFAPAIAAVFDDPAFDGVVVINCGLDIPEFGRGVAAAVGRTNKPTAAFLLDVPKVAAELLGAGVPLFDGPERAVAGYASATSP